jgi:hypothetical protein
MPTPNYTPPDPSAPFRRALENNLELLVSAEENFVGKARSNTPPPPVNGGVPESPQPLEPEAFHGLAGEIVHMIEPHSEADPAALLIQFLSVFGNVIGSSTHFLVESTRHHANLFAVLVGETAKGRKGTSWGQIRTLLHEVEPEWSQKRIVSGLSSGEGIIWAVHDPIEKSEPIREGRRVTGYQSVLADEGVADKRLFIVEEEFSSPLRVMERQGATLSAVLRDAWGVGTLSSLTKNSPARATGAHVSVLGHITRAELLRYLTETESANGFGNRFLWVAVRRSKCLPEGGALSAESLRPLIERLRSAIAFARTAGELRRDEDTRTMWARVYPDLSDGRPGLFGSITSRAEAQVLRLSMIYALLDCSDTIRCEHLFAALAVWEFCAASARYIFGDTLGLPEADEILKALRETPEGLTRSAISDLFRHHRKAAVIEQALRTLEERGLAGRHSALTDGRSAEVWRAAAKEAKDAK